MMAMERSDIVIRQVGDGYVAGVPNLGLYARGATAPAALAALEARRAALPEEIAAVGIAEPFPEPSPHLPQMRFLDSLGLFVAKAIIVFVLLTATLAGTGAFVIGRAYRATIGILGTPTIGGAAFWAKMQEDIHSAADPGKEMPEPVKQRLLADLRVLVARWRPFVAEIAPLIEHDAQPAAPAGSPPATRP
jgi:hypothetical protein